MHVSVNAPVKSTHSVTLMKVLLPQLTLPPGYFNFKRKFLEATRLSAQKMVLMIEFWALFRGGKRDLSHGTPYTWSHY